MRKLFLDIGASQGQSAEYVKNHFEGFEIYSFECDLKNISIIQKKHITNLIPCAAWNSDGKAKYYPGTASGAGTLFENKKTGGVNKNKFYEVTTIDLAKFIIKNFKKEDYIIVKMNCEGSEYILIPHLKKQGLIPWINEWFVNWHWKKIGMSEENHKKIEKIVQSKPWRPC